MAADVEFQRARRPAHVDARRAVILDAAEHLLAERSVDDVTLVQISERSGLAKSGLLRYFDSREAIFLEILDRNREAWLERLTAELPGIPPRAGRYGIETALAAAIARSLIDTPLLCDLIAAMAGVLERNVSVEFARSFKARAAAHHDRLADLIRACLPHMDIAGARHFAGAVFVITAGLWPYARPTAAVAQVMQEMRVPAPQEMFAHNLTEGLTSHLVGVVARLEA
ncbi:TetR/AcrR family transcriptional regulator [Actinoplanes sp. CA-030573]|uniref:TetR/AcrR family transcriptional regulator n=1 Tax=Actinoplanes sp. CA-030573 TaxID=3239898 RepID=UPI003D8E284D